MKKIFTTSIAIAALSLGACTQTGSGESIWQKIGKQEIGAASGAVIGGVLGSNVGGGKGQLIAVGAGTLLGALIGSEIGASLDRADQMYASRALETSYEAPVGETVSWVNPESGNSGTYTPVQEGYGNETGRYCREYKQTIEVDGQQQEAYGTACENPDGSWQIVG